MANVQPHGATKRQCTATNRQGNRCTQVPIPGGNVCRYHGGSAPQVKLAARLRLAAMVDPALDVLLSTIKPKGKEIVKRELKVLAARDILDRNGLKSKEEITLTRTLDIEQFAHLSEEELATLIALAKKASITSDLHGGD